MWNQSLEQVSSLQKSLAPPSDEELSRFYKALSKTGEPVLLSLHSKYSDSYIADYSKLSTPLSSLFDEKCLELPYRSCLNNEKKLLTKYKCLHLKQGIVKLLHKLKHSRRYGVFIELDE